MTLDESSKSLHVADWVIIAIYFLGCIIVGLWVSKVVFMFRGWVIQKRSFDICLIYVLEFTSGKGSAILQ